MKFATNEQLEEALRRAPFPGGATLINLNYGSTCWWKFTKVPPPAKTQLWYKMKDTEPWELLVADKARYFGDCLQVPNKFIIERWLENDNVQK